MNEHPIEPPKWRNGQKKTSLDEGLKRLKDRQAEGQTFTLAEIARECGVDDRAITFIERRAIVKMARGLHSMNPGFFAEILGDRPITEVFDRLGRDPYRTGKPMVRQAKPKKKIFHDECEITMTEVVKTLDHRNAVAKWSNRTGLLRYKRLSGLEDSGRIDPDVVAFDKARKHREYKARKAREVSRVAPFAAAPSEAA